jgi:YbbR domain-containing protein
LKILKKITHNWHIKLISIGLAFVLWIYVQNLKQIEHTYPVPVEVINIPENHIVANEMPVSVNVILKGNERNLQQVEDNGIRAYIDIKHSTNGEKRGVVRIDKNSIPPRVSVKEVNPRVIEIKIEKIAVKTVKVVPVIVDEPPEGYLFQDVVLDPAQVRIKGPDSMVAKIDSVYTSDISIGSLTETIVKEVSVQLADKLSLVDENVINAKIIIKEKYIIKDVKKTEITFVNVKEGLSVAVEDVSPTVFLKIPKRLENSISGKDFSLYVDCKEIEQPGKYPLTLLVELKISDVSLIRIEPPSVEVTADVMQEDEARGENSTE